MSTVSYSIVTPPAPIVTLAQVKAFLQIDPSDTTQDVLIQSFIGGAIAYLDGPDGWLGRFIGQQTVAATISQPLSAPIVLCGPISSLSGVVGLPSNLQYGLSGNALALPFCGGPIFGGGVSVPAVVTYVAGSKPPPPSVALAVMLAVQGLKASYDRDPTLKSEKAGDTQFVYNTDSAMAGAFSSRILSMLSPLRVWR